MSKVEGDLASSVVSTEVLPGDETDGLKISESLSSTTMEKTIRSLFNPNRKPQKRVVPPTNQLSHSKLQAPLSKKRVKRPSTSTIGSDVQPPAVKRAKQAKVSTSTIGGDLRAKQTKVQPLHGHMNSERNLLTPIAAANKIGQSQSNSQSNDKCVYRH